MEPTPVPAPDYSAPMRLWHWLNALLVSGLLLTILFQKVIVQARTAIPEAQQLLRKDGLTLGEQQGRALARIISHRIWDWHIGLGLGLAAAWLLWMGLQVREPQARRFGARLRAVAQGLRLAPPAGKAYARTALATKLSYAAFYLMLVVMVFTGLALTWADDYAWLHALEHTVKEIHEVTMYLILAFSAVHIGGVLRAELTKDHGLISRMIGGR